MQHFIHQAIDTSCYSHAFCGRVCVHACVVYMRCVLHAVRIWHELDWMELVCWLVQMRGWMRPVHVWLVAWLSIIQYKLLPPFLNIVFLAISNRLQHTDVCRHILELDSHILFRMQSLIEISKKTYIWEQREYKTSSTQHPDVPFLVVSEKFIFLFVYRWVGGKKQGKTCKVPCRRSTARFLAPSRQSGIYALQLFSFA